MQCQLFVVPLSHISTLSVLVSYINTFFPEKIKKVSTQQNECINSFGETC